MTVQSPYVPLYDDTHSPGAQSCYTWPGLGLQTIFAGKEDTPELEDVTEDRPMVLGVRFRANLVGDIRAVRFYKSPGEGGSNHVGKIYDWETQELLASTADAGAVVDDSACPGPGWITIDLPTPLLVEPGREYVVALDSLMHYVKTENQLANGWWNNELEAVENGAVYAQDEGYMPTETWLGGNNYWIDGGLMFSRSGRRQCIVPWAPSKGPPKTCLLYVCGEQLSSRLMNTCRASTSPLHSPRPTCPLRTSSATAGL